jgi:hypothetical protein
MSTETVATRACPHCGKTMNAPATLCGYCWKHVVPLGADGLPDPNFPVRPQKRPWWRFGG